VIDGSDRVELVDVDVVSASRFVLTCRVGTRIIAVRPASLLPGTDIKVTGDRGRLVLSRKDAASLGLV
jgi:hypothetical protein